MKRKWFILLVSLMSLTLITIILIQLYWIDNAIKLNEARFDQGVQATLKEIAGTVEKKEDAVLISDRLRKYERTIIDSEGTAKDSSEIHDTILGAAVKKNSLINEEDENDYYIWTNDKAEGVAQITVSSGDVALDLQVDINYDSIKQSLQNIKGYYQLDTLSNALFSRYVYTVSYGDSVNYFIVSHPDAETPKARQLGQVFEQMLIEAEDLVKPLEELYSLNDLATLIQNRLIENGIDQVFEFAVESDEKPGDYIIMSEGFDRDTDQELFSVSLLPDQLSGQNDYHLFLSFPDKMQNLWKSVSLLLLMSAVLTLIVMATFGTTIYMIIRQKRISDIKSDFINNMTHEFKTPIATISLATDAISNPKTLKDQDNVLYYAGIIREENKRMDKQVENVLQMSLLDKHDVDFNIQVKDLHELIRNAIRKISLQVEERKGRIEVTLEAVNHYAEVDEVHFTNAIINLLDNANKYSTEPPEISVNTRNSEQHIHIKISDKGIGMSRDIQKRVFEKFYRESSGNVHNVKGFGLGLAYVKAVMQVFKGKISITSSPGNGSTFEIIVPIIERHG